MYFAFSFMYMYVCICCNFTKQFSQNYRNCANPGIDNTNWNIWTKCLWYDDCPVNVSVWLQLCCGLNSTGEKTVCFAFQITTENKKLQEKVTELETEAEELRRIRKMLESK